MTTKRYLINNITEGDCYRMEEKVIRRIRQKGIPDIATVETKYYGPDTVATEDGHRLLLNHTEVGFRFPQNLSMEIKEEDFPGIIALQEQNASLEITTLKIMSVTYDWVSREAMCETTITEMCITAPSGKTILLADVLFPNGANTDAFQFPDSTAVDISKDTTYEIENLFDK